MLLMPSCLFCNLYHLKCWINVKINIDVLFAARCVFLQNTHAGRVAHRFVWNLEHRSPAPSQLLWTHTVGGRSVLACLLHTNSVKQLLGANAYTLPTLEGVRYSRCKSSRDHNNVMMMMMISEWPADGQFDNPPMTLIKKNIVKKYLVRNN